MNKYENFYLSWLGSNIALFKKNLQSVVRLMPIGILLIMPILILTITNPACTHNDNHAVPDTVPQFTKHCWGPTWSPDGQTIAFGYVPWIKIEEDSFFEIWDSSGIFLIDVDGNNIRPFLLAGISPFLSCSDFSPDGEWLVYVGGQGGVNNIHKARIGGGSITQLTSINYWDRHPKWGPDGKKILFGRTVALGDSCGLCLMDADGSNNKVINRESSAAAGDFLTDYRIVFESWVNADYGIWITDTSGSNKHQILDGYYGSQFSGLNCSPDGSKILFSVYDEEKLRFEIWVMNIDGPDAQRLCIDGIDPCWNPDGTKIVYVKYNFTKQATTHSGYGELWLMDPDGSNQHQFTFIE